MAGEIEAWALTEARHIFLNGVCRCTEEPCEIHLAIAKELQAQRWMGEKIGRRGREAEINAAEQRGFDRAVNETAIASIHKAVAAERASVVAWLRAEAERCAAACARGSHDAWIGMVVLRARADAIERGEHCKEGT